MTTIKIANISKELPRRGDYRNRTLAQITGISVHHSASPMGKFGPVDFARWHIDPKGHLKAPAIAYHYVIEPDGTIYQTNELAQIGWHTVNYNTTNVGVLLNGNFEIEQPTEAQLNSLRQLLQYLQELLGKKLDIRGHKEWTGNEKLTVCPGKNLLKLKNQWT